MIILNLLLNFEIYLEVKFILIDIVFLSILICGKYWLFYVYC